MLILFILVTGIVVGILPGLLKLDKMFGIANIVVGSVGALVFLNEMTLMVAVSFLFVFIKVSVTRNRKAP
jgi:uncharacterized membrane protein YeaQ/YmgE (transglycosylase-associated protein family)